jgi:hypothetical protein
MRSGCRPGSQGQHNHSTQRTTFAWSGISRSHFAEPAAAAAVVACVDARELVSSLSLILASSSTAQAPAACKVVGHSWLLLPPLLACSAHCNSLR